MTTPHRGKDAFDAFNGLIIRRGKLSVEGFVILGGAALLGILCCGGLASCVGSDESHPTVAASDPGYPAPSGSAQMNPKYSALAKIGGNVAHRWAEAAPTDRTVNTDTPLHATVTIRTAGKCTVKLAMSANGPTNQDPGTFYVDRSAGGSISAIVECPDKRAVSMGAAIGPDGVMTTYWSQANTQTNTAGNKVQTSDPVQPSFPPGAAELAQNQTLAELAALTETETDAALPPLLNPILPPPSASASAHA